MPALPAPEASIHQRRRWFYALWGGLLALSLGLLGLWERPVRQGQATLAFRLQLREAPAGTRIQAWIGPWSRWEGTAWSGQGAFAQGPLPAQGELALPVVQVPIATRRWGQGTIPRLTWELLVVKVIPPEGPPRFLPVSLVADIQGGLLRPGRKLTESIDVSWNNLELDGKAPHRLP